MWRSQGELILRFQRDLNVFYVMHERAIIRRMGQLTGLRRSDLDLLETSENHLSRICTASLVYMFLDEELEKV